MGAVILTFVVLATVALALSTWKAAGKEVRRTSQQGKRALDRFLDLRLQLQLDKARSIAELPYLRATLSIPDVDARTLEAALDEACRSADVELAAFLGTDGVVTASWPQYAASLRGRSVPLVDQVLRGEAPADQWLIGDTYWSVSLVPVVAGASAIGALAIGVPLDQRFAP